MPQVVVGGQRAGRRRRRDPVGATDGGSTYPCGAELWANLPTWRQHWAWRRPEARAASCHVRQASKMLVGGGEMRSRGCAQERCRGGYVFPLAVLLCI